MKKIIITILCIISPLLSFAETSNVGIIKGIWFSQSQFFEGDTIRIYTAVQNNSGADVEGNIEFFDNSISLGKKDFSALDGRIIESWTDTLAIPGEHEFSVEITEITKNEAGVELVPVTAQSISSEQIVVVSIDTDGDHIANDKDDDDDGDGFLDEEEIAEGTDPLDENDFPQEETESKNSTEQTIENTSDKMSDEEQEILIEQSPEIIQELAEKNNIIEMLTLQISKLQNTSKNIIKTELERIEKIEQKNSNNKLNEKQESVSLEKDGVENKKETQEKEKTSWEGMFIFIYSLVLKIFSWLFSVWWFVVLLLFFGIYLVLKLLFKIFGDNNL